MHFSVKLGFGIFKQEALWPWWLALWPWWLYERVRINSIPDQYFGNLSFIGIGKGAGRLTGRVNVSYRAIKDL